MKIHGVVYLIVGGFIVGFSYYIPSINESFDIQKFMLFIWVGYVFIAIGLVKLIFGFLSKPRKPKIAKENFPHRQMPQQVNAHQAHNTHHVPHNTQNQGRQFVKFCSGCGSAVRHFDSFCYKCGSRMFHKR